MGCCGVTEVSCAELLPQGGAQSALSAGSGGEGRSIWSHEEAIPGENKCEVIPSGISQAGVQRGFQPEPIREWGPGVEYLGRGTRC